MYQGMAICILEALLWTIPVQDTLIPTLLYSLV